MAKLQKHILSLGTGAVTDGNQEPIEILPADFGPGLARPFIGIAGLAAAETAELYWRVDGGTSWEKVADKDGIQVIFTIDYPGDVINAVGQYGVTKSVTAGTIDVYINSRSGAAT